MSKAVAVKRQSGLELLRLVAMFMVLLLHANDLTFGPMNQYVLDTDPVGGFGRLLLEHLCVISVDVYVFISGWFGIRPKAKSAFNLCFQVATYSFLIWCLEFFFNGHNLHLSGLQDVFIVGKAYWYVVSYLLLYLLAPVLNAFVETSSKVMYRNVLIFFFFFEFLYGWCFGQEYFSDGYSALSFIGLYLLAGYIKKYVPIWKKYSTKCYLFVYFVVTFVFCLIVAVLDRFTDKDLFISSLDYDCPIVVLASVLFFLAFARLDFVNERINSLATSAFAVYLIHIHPFVRQFYVSTVFGLYYHHRGVVGLIYIALFVTAVFLGCIMIDKLRLFILPNEKAYMFLRRFVPKSLRTLL